MKLTNMRTWDDGMLGCVEFGPSKVVRFLWQVENMTKKWHVYMTKDGRISLAGLSSAKAEYLADAIIDSFYNASKSKL